jgi:hypothetical protein
MAIPYSKEMRERAKAEDKFLVQVSIDGKYLRDESAARLQKKFMGHARFQITGPMSHEQAIDLWRWHRRWQVKNAATRKAKK